MILLAEGLHAYFKLSKVQVFLFALLAGVCLVDVGEVVDHQFGVHNAVTLVALPLASTFFDLFESVVRGPFLDFLSLHLLMILPLVIN